MSLSSSDDREQPDASPRPPAPGQGSGGERPADQPKSKPEAQAGSDPALPRFLTHPGSTDKILLTLLAIMTIFSMVMIPLRPSLLVNSPWLLSLLTGSGLGVLITAAHNQGELTLLAGLVAVAAASHIKFMLVYYFMGKHWGQDFISWMFANHTPLWYRKLEGFIERHIYLVLFLGFIPFSPIPAAMVVAIAGIRKLKAWAIAFYIYLLAVANKCFYLYLGLQFGEGIQPTLQTIDRYMMQITLALIAYVFIVNWYKSSKKKP